MVRVWSLARCCFPRAVSCDPSHIWSTSSLFSHHSVFFPFLLLLVIFFLSSSLQSLISSLQWNQAHKQHLYGCVCVCDLCSQERCFMFHRSPVCQSVFFNSFLSPIFCLSSSRPSLFPFVPSLPWVVFSFTICWKSVSVQRSASSCTSKCVYSSARTLCVCVRFCPYSLLRQTTDVNMKAASLVPFPLLSFFHTFFFT